MFVVDRPAAVQNQALHLRAPSVTSADSNRVSLDSLNTILGGSFTSRAQPESSREEWLHLRSLQLWPRSVPRDVHRNHQRGKAEQTVPRASSQRNSRCISTGDISKDEAKKARETVQSDTIGNFGTLSGIAGVAAGVVAESAERDSVAVDLASIDAIDDAKLNSLGKNAVQINKSVLARGRQVACAGATEAASG